MYGNYREDILGANAVSRGLTYSVPFSEGPLLEARLYYDFRFFLID